VRGILASSPSPGEAHAVWPWLLIALFAALGAGLFFLLLSRPVRFEATLKATTKAGVVSLGGGVNVAGFSASAAALLGGPGVVAVYFRSRELWRKSISSVSVEALLVWLDKAADQPETPPGRAARVVAKVKAWLLPRTELSYVPDFAAQLLSDLDDLKLHGGLHCGFADPEITGKAAAVLYPLAGVLSPLGLFDVSFDWSGRTVLDGDFDLSFGVVLGRVLRETARFVIRRVHLRRIEPPSATLPSAAS
jgi:hypothetical protein